MSNPSIPISIPIVRLAFTKEDERAVVEVLRSGWIGQGIKVEALEQALSEIHGKASVIAVNSGTTALYLMLRALGVQSGDKVIVPGFTFVATANMVEQCGATPLFVDIDLNTYNMNPQQLSTTLANHDNVKAIMVVHQFGRLAAMDDIIKVAKEHNVPVLEDAACAEGAMKNGQRVGSWGRAAAFSLHPRKLLTSGEGGYIVTQDRELADQCRCLRNHGLNSNFDMEKVGVNGRLTDLQAALVLNQLPQLSQSAETRRQQAAVYDAAFADLAEIVRPTAKASIVEPLEHVFQSYVIRFKPSWWQAGCAASNKRLDQCRRQLMAECQAAGIGICATSYALAELTYYQQYREATGKDCPNSRLAAASAVALPIYPGLQPQEQAQVVAGLRDRLKLFQERG